MRIRCADRVSEAMWFYFISPGRCPGLLQRWACVVHMFMLSMADVCSDQTSNHCHWHEPLAYAITHHQA